MSSRFPPASPHGSWLRPALPPLLGLVVLWALAVTMPGAVTAPSGPAGSILALAAPVGLLALSATLLRVGGMVDLALGGSAVVAALLAAWLPQATGLAPVWGVLAGIVAGLAIGASNGVLVHVSRAPSWLVTALMLALLSTAPGLLMAPGDLVTAATATARWGPLDWATAAVTLATFRGQPTWPALPVVFWFWLALLAVVPLLLPRTVSGNRILALGVDVAGAERLGMPVFSTRLALLTTAGGLAALAGVLAPVAPMAFEPHRPLQLTAEAWLAAILGGAFGRDRSQAFLASALATLLVVSALWLSGPLPGAARLALPLGAVLALAILIVTRGQRPPLFAET